MFDWLWTWEFEWHWTMIFMIIAGMIFRRAQETKSWRKALVGIGFIGLGIGLYYI